MADWFKRFFEFLFSLHTVHVSDWSRLRFAVDSQKLWWALPLMILLAAYGWWTYRGQSASRGKRLAMGILRAAVLVIVLCLFLRPQLVLEQEERTPSVVALWVDGSQSMSIADPYSTKETDMRGLVKLVSAGLKLDTDKPRANRWDLAMDALTRDKNNWLHQLVKKQDVALYTGGAKAEAIGTAHDPRELDQLLDQLNSRGPLAGETDVPNVVQGIVRDLQGRALSGIVLMTDGRTTDGTSAGIATASAEQFHTPIYPLPIGQTEEPLNVKIIEMTVPESTFVKDPVAVKLKLRVTGLEAGLTSAGPTNLHLTLVRKLPAGGEIELAKRDIPADPAVADMDVEMTFRAPKTSAEKTERFDLEARVDPIGDELELADNKRDAQTTVMDAQINTLLVDGYPRWEFCYLRNELIREKTVNVSSFLVSADEGFAQEGDPRIEEDGKTVFEGPITHFPETAEELSTYDVLLIGDVEPQFFSPNQMKLIVDWVKKGGGIGWIAGWQYNPDAYRGTLLEPLLPVLPDDPANPTMARAENEPFNLRLTAAGKASNLFRFFDDTAMNVQQVEQDNPPMYWYKPVPGLKETAEVLARHPTRSMGGDLAPLIVVMPYDAGQTFFSAVCDTWRWRRYAGEPLYQSYWLQVCRLLYQQKALGQSRRILLTADTKSMEVGAANHIQAQMKDSTLLTGAPAQLTLNVADESGRPLEPMTLSRVQSSTGLYEGVMTPTLTGKLTLSLAPGLGVQTPPLVITVTPPQREMANTTVDAAALTLLAERTQGKVINLQQAGELANLIADRSQVTLTTLSEELWNKWIALILVVGLLTAEWLVRKSAGLI